ncbi:pantoate--beta-alanine ligase [Altibacter sp. HG106]|uniref:pantoate--beta-alanine ligase n=1 Tax=Altibacter sp. HG106 TaxID=3023937 RepID=UPI00234FD858|nr:pantoate--beta-alanine ligase [Altibacter sp. HG106]MDC7995186.1 pantoate--beta-alanine ligase [Altibacter sp. HG106]
MVYHHKDSIRDVLEAYYKMNAPIGLVPTMGALHHGHLELIARSQAENAITIISIFVNPTQFDNAGDLEKYPRTLEQDVAMIKELAGNFIVFNPSPEHLYEDDVRSQSYDFGGIEKEMEGAHRTGHFDGVGTVLSLFFKALKPTNAYFGEKDFQQLQIVRKLVEIESLPVTIVGCPIVREESGLAMSSRNKRLNETELEEATLLHKTLLGATERFESHTIEELKKWAIHEFEKNPNIQLEYFEIAEADTLTSVSEKKKNTQYRVFLAAFVGPVRLIDNMALN